MFDSLNAQYQDENGDIVTDFATFDPAQDEENKINAKHAELPFNLEFIPFYLKEQREYGLSSLETLLYGFIRFFTGGGKDFFVTNKKLGVLFDVHEDTISKAVKILATKGLINCTNRITLAGTRRKISLKASPPLPHKVENGSAVGSGGFRSRQRGVPQKAADIYRTRYTEQDIQNKVRDIGEKRFSPTPREAMQNFILSIEQRDVTYWQLVDSLHTKSNLPPEQISAELDKFINYWCEKTASGAKQRWETQKTFEVQRRLATWFGNVAKYSGFGGKRKKFSFIS